MKNFFKNILEVDLKELFIPVVLDFNSINQEIDKKLISNNNWELANDENAYNDFIEKIEKTKDSGKSTTFQNK